ILINVPTTVVPFPTNNIKSVLSLVISSDGSVKFAMAGKSETQPTQQEPADRTKLGAAVFVNFVLKYSLVRCKLSTNY
ncbi:unnamed protein product, partial [marine sediment metagenome]